MAGVYDYLPLGLKTLKKIENIIREEMNSVGGQEVYLSALQDKSLWEKTDRWDDAKVDNWFKTQLKSGTEVGLGISHEEPLTNLLKDHLNSYKDFPVTIYQFQTKFRNELRAKSGIMRGRELQMKDMYTFCRTEEEHKEIYAKIRDAYIRIFKRVGLGEITHPVFASGGIFSKYSEEFQTECETGEDLIYIDEKSDISVNKEVLVPEVLEELKLKKEDLVEKKAIEVGNIFNLGTRFSEPLGLTVTDESGKTTPAIMGCYGIGVSRLMGAIVELCNDDKGLIWPDEVTPFQVHLVSLGDSVEVKEYSESLYEELRKNNIEVLFDDRDLRAGEKFADSDLIGIPSRAVVSDKTVAEKIVEIKNRKTGETLKTSREEFVADLIAALQ